MTLHQWRSSIRGAFIGMMLLGSAGCDVGRSVFAPLDATIVSDAPPGDVSDATDAPVGAQTCAGFLFCFQSCSGATFGDCLQACMRPTRPAARSTLDDLLTCVRAQCDAGLTESCAATAVTGSCRTQRAACLADGTPPDAGSPDAPLLDASIPDATLDVPATDATCGAGLTSCGGACVDLLTSAAHCAACAATCPTGQSCIAGSCVGTGTCAAPQTACGSSCVDLLTSPTHCGACGRACASAQVCSVGNCVGTGLLRFTMTWNTPGDVDLHVIPPCGMTINYITRGACGGMLDRDDTTGVGPENIFWTLPTAAARGAYLVCIVPFRLGSGSTTATVNVFEGAAIRRTFTRTFTTSEQTNLCSRTSPYFVGEYTY